MKRLFALCLLGVCASVAYGYTPRIYLDVDFGRGPQVNQFHLKSSVLNTPDIYARLYVGTNAWNASGYTAKFMFGKNRNSDTMVTVTGVVGGTYVRFPVATNQFSKPVSEWYAAIVVSKTSPVETHSYAKGLITIDASPEVNATAALQDATPINGSAYGPFTGDFTNWPFAIKGDFGGYVGVAGYRAATNSLQKQIYSNDIDILMMQSYVTNAVTNIAISASTNFTLTRTGKPGARYTLTYPTNNTYFFNGRGYLSEVTNDLEAIRENGNVIYGQVLLSGSGVTGYFAKAYSTNDCVSIGSAGNSHPEITVWPANTAPSMSGYDSSIDLVAGPRGLIRLYTGYGTNEIDFDRYGILDMNMNKISNLIFTGRQRMDTNFLDHVDGLNSIGIGTNRFRAVYLTEGGYYFNGGGTNKVVITTNMVNQIILTNVPHETLREVVRRGATCNLIITLQTNMLASTNAWWARNTSDAADTGWLTLAGGGGPTVDRGAYVRPYGNEAAVGTRSGDVWVVAGNKAGGDVMLATSNETARMRVQRDGKFYFYGNQLKQLGSGSATNDAARLADVIAATNNLRIRLSLSQVLQTDNQATYYIAMNNLTGIGVHGLTNQNTGEIWITGGNVPPHSPVGGVVYGGTIYLDGNQNAYYPGGVWIQAGYGSGGTNGNVFITTSNDVIGIQVSYGRVLFGSNLMHYGTLSTGITYKGNTIATNHLTTNGAYLAGVNAERFNSRSATYYVNTNGMFYKRAVTNVVLSGWTNFAWNQSGNWATNRYPTNISFFANNQSYLQPAATNTLRIWITNQVYVKANGTVPMTGNLNMNSKSITNGATVSCTNLQIAGVGVDSWGDSGTMADGSTVENGLVTVISDGETNFLAEAMIRNTNVNMDANLLTNGTFTGHAGGWALTNATYFGGPGTYTNTVYIAPGQIGYLSLKPAVAPHPNCVYLITYYLYWFSGSLTNTVRYGGYTNVHVLTASGAQALYMGTRSTGNLNMTIKPTASQGCYVDNVTVQRVRTGDAWIAGRVAAGSLYVGSTNILTSLAAVAGDSILSVTNLGTSGTTGITAQIGHALSIRFPSWTASATGAVGAAYLAASGVSAGTYTGALFVADVDTDGRLTGMTRYAPLEGEMTQGTLGTQTVADVTVTRLNFTTSTSGYPGSASVVDLTLDRLSLVRAGRWEGDAEFDIGLLGDGKYAQMRVCHCSPGVTNVIVWNTSYSSVASAYMRLTSPWHVRTSAVNTWIEVLVYHTAGSSQYTVPSRTQLSGAWKGL